MRLIVTMENLSLKRNIKPFDGEKYSVWKFRLRALLTELNVIKVIDEEVTDQWMAAERTAKNVIVEYLADSFLTFAKTDNTAKDIFLNLDRLYERKSLATQLALLITAIETLTEDNLTLTFVNTRLLDHEVKLTSESRDTSAKILQVSANVSFPKKRNFETPRRNIKRNYQGYFKGRHFKSDAIKHSTSVLKCYHCGKNGHTKKQCFHYNGHPGNA